MRPIDMRRAADKNASMNRFLHRGRVFIHLLLIAAFVTAGISPACAFISGAQSSSSALIEICAGDGSVKTIAVPAAQSPLPVSGPEQSPAPHHSGLSDQCAFCFTAAHSQALSAAPMSLPPPAALVDDPAPPFVFVPRPALNALHGARAPPSYL